MYNQANTQLHAEEPTSLAISRLLLPYQSRVNLLCTVLLGITRSGHVAAVDGRVRSQRVQSSGVLHFRGRRIGVGVASTFAR